MSPRKVDLIQDLTQHWACAFIDLIRPPISVFQHQLYRWKRKWAWIELKQGKPTKYGSNNPKTFKGLCQMGPLSCVLCDPIHPLLSLITSLLAGPPLQSSLTYVIIHHYIGGKKNVWDLISEEKHMNGGFNTCKWNYSQDFHVGALCQLC